VQTDDDLIIPTFEIGVPG